MPTGLPDRQRPERRKQILPPGVVRAKDNTDDFSFSSKSVQAEAEHNMGYYLAELNNRNLELEDEVERQDKELSALRLENAELRERNMKVVTAAVPPALPDFSNGARIQQQRLRLEHKDQALQAAQRQNIELQAALDTAQYNEHRLQEKATHLQTAIDSLRSQVQYYSDLVQKHESKSWLYKAVTGAAIIIAVLCLI